MKYLEKVEWLETFIRLLEEPSSAAWFLMSCAIRGYGEMTGGGGTDFRPVFQYIDEHSELDPSLLIYFTDGCGAYPERPPAYPVMWLLTSDGSCDVNWGTQVRFKRDA